MSKILGIDLGTSTTCVSVVQDGKPVVIPGVRDAKVTPSYIYVMEDGRILVGENAKMEVIADPYNTIWATKRLIGRRFDDEAVKECLKRFSYRIQPSDKGGVVIRGRKKAFTPIKVASLILKFATRLASNYLGQPAEKAVITVPASFNDLQRKATKMAGENVGLEVVRLVNEPTAAALAWGYKDDVDCSLAVYDLGGGTFDVSILSIGHGVYEVIATSGNSWLGGEDFDNRLVDYVIKMFKSQYDIDIHNDKIAHQRVKTACEKAKIELSSEDSTRIFIEKICPDMHETADVDYTITRSHFEGMIEDMVNKTVETFKQTLKDAEMELDQLDNVILVGGMTRVPLVRRKIEEFLGRDPDYSINPDEAVALGAAVHAAALAGEEVEMRAAPDSQATARPAEEEEADFISAMMGQEGAPGAEPAEQGVVPAGPAMDDSADLPVPIDGADEAVPLGAAETDAAPDTPPPPPAAAKPPTPPKRKKAPLLIDVVSQSVGIADMAGLFVPLIQHNSKLPAKVSQVFTTCIDQQEVIKIEVYQGEERLVKDKVMLGEFKLAGIETAVRGVPQILVSFSIDQSGIFTVSAKDLKTDAEKEIQVEGLRLG